ncbi:MAG: diacylglycerol kinase family protein [Bacteroidota bacterium]
MPRESFLKNRIRSFGFAFKGLFLLLKTEASIKIQCVIALLVTGAGFHFEISATEWALQCLSIGLVMAIEGVNTAIEKLADYTQPEYDKHIGFVKDISAGAVMLAAIIAAIVGLIIYFPKLT